VQPPLLFPIRSLAAQIVLVSGGEDSDETSNRGTENDFDALKRRPNSSNSRLAHEPLGRASQEGLLPEDGGRHRYTSFLTGCTTPRVSVPLELNNRKLGTISRRYDPFRNAHHIGCKFLNRTHVNDHTVTVHDAIDKQSILLGKCDVVCTGFGGVSSGRYFAYS